MFYLLFQRRKKKIYWEHFDISVLKKKIIMIKWNRIWFNFFFSNVMVWSGLFESTQKKNIVDPNSSWKYSESIYVKEVSNKILKIFGWVMSKSLRDKIVKNK